MLLKIYLLIFFVPTELLCNFIAQSLITLCEWPVLYRCHCTLPTRLSETTCTLIDNIITNNIDNNHLSGVLTRKISDHQMNFCMIKDKRTAPNNKGKFIEVEKTLGMQ